MKLETFISLKTPLARRKIFSLLKEKKILVNGKIAVDLLMSINPSIDKVKVATQTLSAGVPAFVYYKFYKPKDVISTLGDPKGRKNLEDFIKKLPEYVFPVGRLDRNTTGLLLFTNNGEFANKLCHPHYKVAKLYRVTLDKKITKQDLLRFEQTMILEDGPFSFKKIDLVEPTVLMVTLEEGRNRIIRRACAHLGYEVTRLKRYAIGPIELGTLEEGHFKKLTKSEISAL